MALAVQTARLPHLTPPGADCSDARAEARGSTLQGKLPRDVLGSYRVILEQLRQPLETRRRLQRLLLHFRVALPLRVAAQREGERAAACGGELRIATGEKDRHRDKLLPREMEGNASKTGLLPTS